MRIALALICFAVFLTGTFLFRLARDSQQSREPQIFSRSHDHSPSGSVSNADPSQMRKGDLKDGTSQITVPRKPTSERLTAPSHNKTPAPTLVIGDSKKESTKTAFD